MTRFVVFTSDGIARQQAISQGAGDPMSHCLHTGSGISRSPAGGPAARRHRPWVSGRRGTREVVAGTPGAWPPLGCYPEDAWSNHHILGCLSVNPTGGRSFSVPSRVTRPSRASRRRWPRVLSSSTASVTRNRQRRVRPRVREPGGVPGPVGVSPFLRGPPRHVRLRFQRPVVTGRGRPRLLSRRRSDGGFRGRNRGSGRPRRPRRRRGRPAVVGVPAPPGSPCDLRGFESGVGEFR